MDEFYKERLSELEKKTFTARLPYTDILVVLAEAEGVSASALVAEGVLRVIDTRRENPEYSTQVRQSILERQMAIEETLKLLDGTVD